MDADPATELTDVVPQVAKTGDKAGGYAEGATIALSYRELADRLGVAVEAVKARARRGGWAKVPGNDGAVRVQVPVAALGEPKKARDALPRPVLAQGTEPALIAFQAALDAQVEAHRAELGRLDAAHRAELERMAQGHAAELDRLGEAHRAELARLEAGREAVVERFQEAPGLRGRVIRWLAR